jgi:hypothetical protein
MEVAFNALPESSRVWIYQADRLFRKEDKQIISTALSSFLQLWTAHGNTLKAAFDLPYDQFIVIGLDEQHADTSGCSIDGLFRVLQQLSAETQIDFFNRNRIAFKKEEGIILIDRTLLKEKASEWNAQTLTFNNLVQTKAALQTEWIVPAEVTWLKRYFLHTA